MRTSPKRDVMLAEESHRDHPSSLTGSQATFKQSDPHILRVPIGGPCAIIAAGGAVLSRALYLARLGLAV